MPFRSPWADIDVPDLSLPEFVLERAHELGSKPALVEAATGRALSYAALDECVRRTAAGLAARGFGRGDVLAVFAPNRIDWPIAFLGAALAGGAVTGVNQAFTADEVAAQLRDAGARHLVTTAALLDRAVPAAAAASVESVLVLDGGPQRTPFATLLEHDEAPPEVTPDPTDTAFLPCSSGTTGLPKCVELSHRALVANSCQLGVGFAFDESQVHLAVAPFHGAAGTGLVIDTALRHGVTVVLAPRFEVGEIVRLIQRHHVTDCGSSVPGPGPATWPPRSPASPRCPSPLVDLPSRHGERRSHRQTSTPGASPCPTPDQKQQRST